MVNFFFSLNIIFILKKKMSSYVMVLLRVSSTSSIWSIFKDKAKEVAFQMPTEAKYTESKFRITNFINLNWIDEDKWLYIQGQIDVEMHFIHSFLSCYSHNAGMHFPDDAWMEKRQRSTGHKRGFESSFWPSQSRGPTRFDR